LRKRRRVSTKTRGREREKEGKYDRREGEREGG
jgi:hypothetical protein